MSARDVLYHVVSRMTGMNRVRPVSAQTHHRLGFGICRLLRAIALSIGLGCAPALHAADVQRFGLFVGQNNGGKETRPLLYADQDARRIQEVLERLGSVEKSSSILLRGASRAQIVAALNALGERIRAAREAGQRTVLYFYYSGHADKNGLLLQSQNLTVDELKRYIKASGADLQVMFLDACQSGVATRTKGGTRAPSFLVEVEEGDQLQGDVIITSSAENEASQESDRVGGGYFTHHLVAGLQGAADASKDGAVSLEEAYAYAYHRTLYETAGSAGGLQHPNILTDLKGHGTLVLTRPAMGQTVLVFPAGLEGTYLIFDRQRRLFVAELKLSGAEPQQLALPAGQYLVQKRESDHLLSAQVTLTRGSTRQLEPSALTRTGFEQDFSRGVEQANVRRASSSALQLSAQTGVQQFFLQPADAVQLPGFYLTGMALGWRGVLGPDWTLSADFAAGTTETELDYTYRIPVIYDERRAGLGLRYQLLDAPLRLALGSRVDALYIKRSFPETREPEETSLTTSPGLTLDLGLPIAPMPGLFSAQTGLELGLQLRAHYLLYIEDSQNLSMGWAEGLVQLSWTF